MLDDSGRDSQILLLTNQRRASHLFVRIPNTAVDGARWFIRPFAKQSENLA